MVGAFRVKHFIPEKVTPAVDLTIKGFWVDPLVDRAFQNVKVITVKSEARLRLMIFIWMVVGI